MYSMEDKLLLLGVGRKFVWRMYEFIQVSIKKVTDYVLDIRFSFFPVLEGRSAS